HESHLEAIDAYTGTGVSLNAVAGRLAYLLDLRGPCLVVDTACSSSLVALHLACQSLRAGECRQALVGGVNVLLTPMSLVPSSKMGMLAADGRCKTFDARADGVGISEGCGVVVLKRLSDALAAGDPIVGVIRGSATNQDGRSNGLTAPNGVAQQLVLRQALEAAGLRPDDVGYVETHGTGTALGDPIELEAIREVYGARPPGRACVLGGVKANLGHTGAAAGMAGLIKVLLALEHGEIPAQPDLGELNPNIDLRGTPFVIPRQARPWQREAQPRRAGLSSFGWSGTNVHVIVEEAPEGAPVERAAPDVLVLPVSARTPQALADQVRRYHDHLAGPPPDGGAIADVCYSAAVHRSHFEHRCAFWGQTRADLLGGLEAFLAGDHRSGNPFGAGEPGGRKPVVFAFSGQGTQWPGMARQLFEREPVFRESVEACDVLFRDLAGWSLAAELAAPEAAARLDRTEIVQPLLFAIQVGLSRLWQSYGVRPDAVVGHSSGEVAAACVAGALDLEQAIGVVYHRSRLMQSLAGRGRMLAAELPVADARQRIAGWPLSIAAVNGPRSVVLSGPEPLLAEYAGQLRADRIAHRWLEGHYAFHSEQIDTILPELQRALVDLRPKPPTLALYSTVFGRRAESEPLDARYWARNARDPVRFADAVAGIAGDAPGASGTPGAPAVWVEIGPQPVLARALAHCLQGTDAPQVILPSLRRGRPDRQTLLRSLGQLYASGHPITWQGVHTSGGSFVSLPTYPWQHESFWPEFGPAPAPLPGRRLRSAGREVVFESIAGAREYPFLRDHRYFGRMVVPAAYHLALAIAAGQALRAGPCAVEDAVFATPLLLPDEGARDVQIVLRELADESRSFEIFSAP
ncbi:MAG: type I polyketide synthase, partial [Chloroflexota bacterium]